MKILIVDDHALFREGLCYVLRDLDPQVAILEASGYEHALQLVAANPELDLVLLDLHLPDRDGFSILETLVGLYSTLPVVIVSASNHRYDIQRSLNAGAMGYITKDTTSSVMLAALQQVLAGDVYVPPQAHSGGGDDTDLQDIMTKLTPRQIQVLSLVVRGDSNKDIADKLQLAEATVKMHVTAIMKTFGVANRTQAAMVAEKLGIRLSSN